MADIRHGTASQSLVAPFGSTLTRPQCGKSCQGLRCGHFHVLTTSNARLGQETTDFLGNITIYGPIQVQNPALAGSEVSQTIADSYSWFANEAYWSMTCGKTFGLAQVGDDQDPNCSDAPCSEPASG